MPKRTKSARAGKSSKSKRGGANSTLTAMAKQAIGDIPQSPRCDVITRSTGIPSATSHLIFHQHAPPVKITGSNTSIVSDAITFALNGLEGTGTLTAMFEFYRIRAIRVCIQPQNNAIGVVDPTITKLVELYCTIDYNDSTPPASAAYMREVDNCVILPPGQSLERTFQPKMSAVVKSAAGTDYMSVDPQWLNTGSDDVLHYGLKYLVPQVNVAQASVQTWQIDTEYWLEFSKLTG